MSAYETPPVMEKCVGCFSVKPIHLVRVSKFGGVQKLCLECAAKAVKQGADLSNWVARN